MSFAFDCPLKAYIVHYTPFIERKQHIVQEMAKHSIDPIFVESFDKEVLTESDKDRFDLGQVRLGYVSSFLKHVECWRRIANDETNDIGIVFEDDSVLCESFTETFKECIRQLPDDFDLLMINGGCNLHIPSYLQVEGKLVYLKGNEPTSWGGHGSTRCIDAYVLSRKGARHFVDQYERQSSGSIKVPCDHQLNQYIRNVNARVFWAEPQLCFQGTETGMFVTWTAQ